jgi:hypothetical protein
VLEPGATTVDMPVAGLYHPNEFSMREKEMRILLKVSIPVEIGNAKIKDGSLAKTMQSILEEQKPEAAYFVEDNGTRTGFIVVNIDDASQIPAIAEPWFLAFNAGVELRPAMVAEDLMKAGPAIEQAVKKYG